MDALLDVSSVRHEFVKGENHHLILENVNLTLQPREIVGLLGRSGSGKSTLLRIIAGLIQPTAGTVRYKDVPVDGPAEGVAMVFQTFGLFPWLTVLQNVEVGLEALRIPENEIRRRSLEAIDLIGLDGFESAYPRELSGGMRQRVGFARALVVNPPILLMDEPFSALDVLTAETLRTDFLDLWNEQRLPTESVLLVTHNIEEAVLMCDRVMIFASNPGRIAMEIPMSLPHPRNRLDPEFREIVDYIYNVMTARPVQPVHQQAKGQHATIGERLHNVSTNAIAGMIETLAATAYEHHADLPNLASDLTMEVDQLLPVAETLDLLGFAVMAEGDISLTASGKAFADMDTENRKHLFATHLDHHVALARHIKRVLDDRPDHRAPRIRFVTELEDHLNETEATETLDALTNWARYAELFSYNDSNEMFSLENPRAVEE
jgi:NitT/TauT family transport system ATP-binding protein